MTSPKLYLIKNNEGNYYNGKTKYFHKKLYLATYASSRKEAEKIIAFYDIQNCEVEEMTEDVYLTDLADLTTKIIIKIDSLKSDLEVLQYNIPTLSGVNKNLKNFLKNTSEKLKLVNPIMNDFYKEDEEAIYTVLDMYNVAIDELADLHLKQYPQLGEIIHALKKDEKSILGVARKVNKYKS